MTDAIAAALCVPVPFVLRFVTRRQQAALLLEVAAGGQELQRLVDHFAATARQADALRAAWSHVLASVQTQPLLCATLPLLAQALDACAASRTTVLRRLRALEASLRAAEPRLAHAAEVSEDVALDLDFHGLHAPAAARRAVAGVQRALAQRLRLLCVDGGDVEGLRSLAQLADELALTAQQQAASVTSDGALPPAPSPALEPSGGASGLPPPPPSSDADASAGGSSDSDEGGDSDGAGAPRRSAKRARAAGASPHAKRARGTSPEAAPPAAADEDAPPPPLSAPSHEPSQAQPAAVAAVAPPSPEPEYWATAPGAEAAPAGAGAAAWAVDASQRSMLGSVSPGRGATTAGGLLTPAAAPGSGGGPSPGVGSGAGGNAGAAPLPGSDAGAGAAGGTQSPPRLPPPLPYLFSVAPSTAPPARDGGSSPSTLPLGQRVLSFASPAWVATGPAAAEQGDAAGAADATPAPLDDSGGLDAYADAAMELAHVLEAAPAAVTPLPPLAASGEALAPTYAPPGWAPTPGSGGWTGLGGPYGDVSPAPSASPWLARPQLQHPSQQLPAEVEEEPPLPEQAEHSGGAEAHTDTQVVGTQQLAEAGPPAEHADAGENVPPLPLRLSPGSSGAAHAATCWTGAHEPHASHGSGSSGGGASQREVLKC